MGSSSPQLSDAEREALPSLWATRSGTVRRPRVGTTSRNPTRRDHDHAVSSDQNSNSRSVKTPLTAPQPPAPYETPVYIQQGPKSEPNPPKFVVRTPPTIHALPTPPDSDGSWCATSASGSISPQSKQPTSALPGTMTSRSTEGRTRSRNKTGHSGRPSRKLSRMQRWRSVVKEMFTHEPVDESQFEHITDCHWTDE